MNEFLHQLQTMVETIDGWYLPRNRIISRVSQVVRHPFPPSTRSAVDALLRDDPKSPAARRPMRPATHARLRPGKSLGAFARPGAEGVWEWTVLRIPEDTSASSKSGNRWRSLVGPVSQGSKTPRLFDQNHQKGHLGEYREPQNGWLVAPASASLQLAYGDPLVTQKNSMGSNLNPPIRGGGDQQRDHRPGDGRPGVL